MQHLVLSKHGRAEKQSLLHRAQVQATNSDSTASASLDGVINLCEPCSFAQHKDEMQVCIECGALPREQQNTSSTLAPFSLEKNWSSRDYAQVATVQSQILNLVILHVL